MILLNELRRHPDGAHGRRGSRMAPVTPRVDSELGHAWFESNRNAVDANAFFSTATELGTMSRFTKLAGFRARLT